MILNLNYWLMKRYIVLETEIINDGYKTIYPDKAQTFSSKLEAVEYMSMALDKKKYEIELRGFKIDRLTRERKSTSARITYEENTVNSGCFLINITKTDIEYGNMEKK